MANNTAVKMVGTVAPTPPSTTVPPTNGRYRVEHGTETGAPRWGWVDGAALTRHHPPNAGLSAVRTDALMRARSAMGFSYWWDHGQWLKSGPAITCDGAGQNCVPNAGRCTWNAGATDGCPQCTHAATGGTEYGADCSGFVSTIWGFSSGGQQLEPGERSRRLQHHHLHGSERRLDDRQHVRDAPSSLRGRRERQRTVHEQRAMSRWHVRAVPGVRLLCQRPTC